MSTRMSDRLTERDSAYDLDVSLADDSPPVIRSLPSKFLDDFSASLSRSDFRRIAFAKAHDGDPGVTGKDDLRLLCGDLDHVRISECPRLLGAHDRVRDVARQVKSPHLRHVKGHQLMDVTSIRRGDPF